MNPKQFNFLARYFNEAVTFSRHIKATTQMNVHFLGPVSEGRITCWGEVVHRTSRTATAEGRVYDEEGNLVALGTGAFRVFEKRGNPIV